MLTPQDSPTSLGRLLRSGHNEKLPIVPAIDHSTCWEHFVNRHVDDPFESHDQQYSNLRSGGISS